MNKIEFTLKNKCGIYIIFNINNGKRYIGSSKDLYNRIHEHLHNLNNNKSHNKYLQNSWNKHGEDMFIYGVLEFCDEEIRFNREQYFINCFHPEYNLTDNVIANYGSSPSTETRLKISNTLKEKYAKKEIETYKQEHNWKTCYVYNINNWTLCYIGKNTRDTENFLKYKKRGSYSQLCNTLISNKYIVSITKFEYEYELKNYVYKNILKYRGNVGSCKYCIISGSNELKYFKNLVDAALYCNGSKSTLSKHTNASIDNPYTIKNTNYKFYMSDVFIPLSANAVLIEESLELSEGKIEESPEMDNIEVTN